MKSSSRLPANHTNRANAHGYPPGSTLPKSTAQIRKVLKSVTAANEQSDPGPLRKGLGKHDWVVAQSFTQTPDWYVSILGDHHIECQMRRCRAEYVVQVQYPDLGAARTLYEEHV